MECAHCLKPFKVGESTTFTELGHMHNTCYDTLVIDRRNEEYHAFCNQNDLDGDVLCDLFWEYAGSDRLAELKLAMAQPWAIIMRGIEDNENNCISIHTFKTKKEAARFLEEVTLDSLQEDDGTLELEYILKNGKIHSGWWDIKLKIYF